MEDFLNYLMVNQYENSHVEFGNNINILIVYLKVYPRGILDVQRGRNQCTICALSIFNQSLDH